MNKFEGDKMNKFKKGENYQYLDIEKEAIQNHYLDSEFGNAFVGEQLIIIKHGDKDLTCSFLLVSQSKRGFIYECVYNDWK